MQFLESTAGAVVLAGVAGLIAGNEGEGRGVVGERAEGQGDMDVRIGLDELAVDFGSTARNFGVEEDGFDGADAVEAPGGGDHFADEVVLDRAHGLVGFVVIIHKLLKFLWFFALQHEEMA